jgi:hypothetical protein
MSKLKGKQLSAPGTRKKGKPNPASDNTEGKVDTRFKAGAEWRGNAAGRPKGARSKLTTEFFENFHAAWQEHGADALKKVAESSPRDFVRAAAMLMPKEVELKSPLNDLSDDELAELIAEQAQEAARAVNAHCQLERLAQGQSRLGGQGHQDQVEGASDLDR